MVTPNICISGVKSKLIFKNNKKKPTIIKQKIIIAKKNTILKKVSISSVITDKKPYLQILDLCKFYSKNHPLVHLLLRLIF